MHLLSSCILESLPVAACLMVIIKAWAMDDLSLTLFRPYSHMSGHVSWAKLLVLVGNVFLFYYTYYAKTPAVLDYIFRYLTSMICECQNLS